MAIGLLVAATASGRAGYQSPTAASQGTSAAEVDPASRAIPEVDKAIRSFEGRDFDASLKLLIGAVKAHRELPPALID